jgi:Fe-S-cluster containining protein
VLLDDGSILPFINDRCPHLSEAGRCGIYETRPVGCRAFNCSHEPGYLRTHPQVAALLSLHGVPMSTVPPEALPPGVRTVGGV